MNASFEPFHLVNTYGAFGSITRTRNEIIIEGTSADVPDESAEWRSYEFKAKPGDVTRKPPLVSPYHYKIDWQMWFAAMNDARYHPWFFNLVAKFLKGDPGALSLIRANPFPENPPKYIRASLYEYHFADPEDKAAVWKRSYVSPYLTPVSLQDAQFQHLLQSQGWEE